MAKRVEVVIRCVCDSDSTVDEETVCEGGDSTAGGDTICVDGETRVVGDVIEYCSIHIVITRANVTVCGYYYYYYYYYYRLYAGHLKLYT
jgi:hypothetical protein